MLNMVVVMTCYLIVINCSHIYGQLHIPSVLHYDYICLCVHMPKGWLILQYVPDFGRFANS